MPEKLKGIDSLNSVQGNLFIMPMPSIQKMARMQTLL